MDGEPTASQAERRAALRRKRRLERLKPVKTGRKRKVRPEGPQELPIRSTQEYRIASRRGAKPHDLVIMFSAGGGFALLNVDFGRDVVFVVDARRRYFIKGAKAFAETLLEFIDRGGYKRVMFTGSSKGGFGALMFQRICAEMRPDRVFHAVGFNPQARLYPWNENLSLTIPSYGTLGSAAEADELLALGLRRYADLSLLGYLPNILAIVMYARGHALDRLEAAKFKGPNVVRKEVVGALHASKLNFLKLGKERGPLSRQIRKLMSRTGDRDLNVTEPERFKAIVDEMLEAALREPDMSQLFDEVLAMQPIAPPTLEAWRSRVSHGVWRMKVALTERFVALSYRKAEPAAPEPPPARGAEPVRRKKRRGAAERLS